MPGRLPAVPPSWPTMLGVAGMVWGAMGVAVNFCAGSMPWLIPWWEQLARSARPGAAAAPASGWSRMYLLLPNSAVGAALSMFLIVGCLGVLRRMPAGPARLRRWATIALCWLPISMAVGLMCAPDTTFAYGPGTPQAAARFGQAFGFLIGVVCGAVPPAFVLFWLSRPRVKAEIARWGGTTAQ
jgi:hypothetical protein